MPVGVALDSAHILFVQQTGDRDTGIFDPLLRTGREQLTTELTMIRYLMLASRHLEQRLLQFLMPQYALAGIGLVVMDSPPSPSTLPNPALWFAVPKNRTTRRRKRVKNWNKRQIYIKQNIIRDPRTGELTLMHRMPFNWKDYLPKVS